MLFISLLLAVLPLAGIAWFATSGNLTTVDGLFMSLILLTISGIFGMNALGELHRSRKKAEPAPKTAAQKAT